MKKSRGTLSFVIPEICYRESTPPPSFPKFFIGNPNLFKYCGPQLKDCRGDEEVGIHAFCP